MLVIVIATNALFHPPPTPATLVLHRIPLWDPHLLLDTCLQSLWGSAGRGFGGDPRGGGTSQGLWKPEQPSGPSE